MLDQFNDSNKSGIFALSKVLDFPEFVKEAHIDPDERASLPTRAFADTVNRMFPVHTRAHTWLSAGYFSKYADQDPGIQKTLDDACKSWGIEPPAMREPVAKEARYTINYPDPCNHSSAINNADDLIKVAEDIRAHGRYPLSVRMSVARQVLRAPEDLQINLPRGPELHKIAGYGVGLESAALATLRQRELMSEKSWPACVRGFKEAAEYTRAVAVKGVLSPEFTIKLAGMVDAFDRFSQAHTRYNQAFQAPERLFECTTRDIDDIQDSAVWLSTGNMVSRQLLKTAASRKALRHMGCDISTDDKLFESIAGLPERRARVLLNAIGE